MIRCRFQRNTLFSETPCINIFNCLIVEKYDRIVAALEERQRSLEESRREKRRLLELEEKESVEVEPVKVGKVVKGTGKYDKIVKALKELKRLMEELEEKRDRTPTCWNCGDVFGPYHLCFEPPREG